LNNKPPEQKPPQHPLNDGGNQPPVPPIPNKNAQRLWIGIGIFTLLALFLFLSGGSRFAQDTYPMNALVREINAENVSSIVQDGNANVTITLRSGGTRQMSIPPGTDIGQLLGETYQIPTEKLLLSNISYIPADDTGAFMLQLLIGIGPMILIIWLIWRMMRSVRGQQDQAMSFGRSRARVARDMERPQVTFNDVAGCDEAKEELKEVVEFLKEPEKFIRLGARVPKGVLMVGPPGTGKTLMARAVAGEAGVPFFSISGSEFVEMFVGVGASRVRDLFKRARDNAPSIVFIDEIDAVGRQRGAGLGGGHDEREQTLNQMLAEMDGFDQTESVIVMAATNRHDVLDPALLRPGRFDRQVTVGLPDKKGRLEILKIHTRGKPLDGNVNLDDLAKGTIGFSGADLSNLCNEAALNAARRNGKRITMRDFSNAFDRIVLGTESPPLSDAHERKVVAYHEAGHAVVAALLPNSDPVLKVTIVPRGQALGVTAYMPESDRRNYSRGYLYTKIMTLLGGRAAEEIIIKEVTTGAENDLRRATDLARRMVSNFGMSESFGLLNFGDDERQPFLGYSLSQSKSYSEETAAEIDAEVRRVIKQAHDQTIALLTENKDKLIALAEALLVQEVIEQDEMWRVIGMENDPRYEKFANTHFAISKVSKEVTDENGSTSEETPHLEAPPPPLTQADSQ